MRVEFIEKFLTKQSKIIVLAGIAIFGFALYGPSLKNDFVHDDEGQIIQNPYIKGFEHIAKAFTSCIWEAYADGCEGRTNYYRPLHTISYLLTYTFNSTPLFFHFVNLVYYTILVWLVFLFAEKLLKNRIAAGITSFLFLLHPVHTESVLWIASVPELLYSIFAVLALLLYFFDVKYKEWLVGGVFFLGLLAKEPAVFVPVIIFIMSREAILRQIRKGGERKLYFVFVLFFVLYFFMRTFAIGGIGKRPDFYDFSFMERIYTGIFVFGEYVKKTLFPIELNPFIPFEPISSFSDARFLSGFVFAIAFALLFVWALRKREKILILGMGIFFLFISPVVIFINSIAENVIAERYLLLPSLGFALIAGHYLSLLIKSKRDIVKWAALTILAVFAGFSMPKVYAQNQVWKSSKALYEHSYALNNSKGDLIDVTSVYDLAVLYEQEGKVAEAKALYERVIQSGERKIKIPSRAKAYNNIGNIYVAEKEYDRAIDLFKNAVMLNPEHAGAYSNMAVAYSHKGEYISAVENFINALAINPQFESARQNIRVLFAKIGALPSYNQDGAPGKLHNFVTGLLKSPVWRDWEYRKINKEDALTLYSVSPKKNGAAEVLIKANPTFQMSLFPLIFSSLDGEIILRPKISGEFNKDKGELLLRLPEGKKGNEKSAVLEHYLYIVLEDFTYYKFKL